jgi:hypothetical protein
MCRKYRVAAFQRQHYASVEPQHVVRDRDLARFFQCSKVCIFWSVSVRDNLVLQSGSGPWNARYNFCLKYRLLERLRPKSTADILYSS